MYLLNLVHCVLKRGRLGVEVGEAILNLGQSGSGIQVSA